MLVGAAAATEAAACMVCVVTVAEGLQQILAIAYERPQLLTELMTVLRILLLIDLPLGVHGEKENQAAAHAHGLHQQHID